MHKEPTQIIGCCIKIVLKQLLISNNIVAVLSNNSIITTDEVAGVTAFYTIGKG